MSNRNFTLLMMGLVVGFCVLVFVINSRQWARQSNKNIAEKLLSKIATGKDKSTTKSKDGLPMLAEGREWVGGIPRPKTDMIDGTSQPKAFYPNPNDRIGRAPTVDPSVNRFAKVVSEAAQSGKHPERLSYFSRPRPFDLVAFESDPDAYLNNIEPGRIMQTSKISPDTDPIKRDGNYFQAMVQGETVTLKAKVKPMMPVTFYSPHVGQFQNSLSTVTVRADESGLAEAQYTAVKGVVGDIDILAASPVHSHQVRYLVRVEVPEPLPKLPGK